LYALVKLSKPQGQNETNQAENPTIEVQADAGESNNAPPAERPDSADSPTQVEDVGNAGKDPLKQNSGSAVPPAIVEAVIKEFEKFQSCLKDEDYQQAWELTTEHFKNEAVHGGFEGFKSTCIQMGMATVTLYPESATYIDGMVALRVTGPLFGGKDLYFSFVEEDGQWKLFEGHNP
jgi:hypothetical protein